MIKQILAEADLLPMKSVLLFFVLINVTQAEVSALNLCQSINGDLRPIEKLVCESSAALLESMNPSLKIPNCHNNTGPQLVSGEKPISAVFVSCTHDTYNSCYNIASSVMKEQPGVTVNVLVTTNDFSNADVYKKLLSLNEESKKLKTPFNILPINKSNSVNIAYSRDPGLFVSGNKTSFVALPYTNQGIPGAFIMEEAMNLCGIESTDTYRKLAGFDSAYQSLVVDPKLSEHNEKIKRETHAIQVSREEQSENATMGGNFMALPNGTLVTGRTRLNSPDNNILNHFSTKNKVMVIDLPDLSVGHIDEVINVIPSTGPCGYALLQASPNEAVKFLSSTLKPNDPFLAFFDLDLMMKDSPEKKAIQEVSRNAHKEFANFKEKYPGLEPPLELITKINSANDMLLKINGQHTRTPNEILRDTKLMNHWKKLEDQSNHVRNEILKELSLKNNCRPEIIKLPVFWDVTMTRPMIPNPINGLSVNGSYFRSESSSSLTDEKSIHKFKDLDIYIDEKLQKFFPKGVVKVDTQQHDQGSGNFHCATTNIYLPCKN